MPHIIIEYADIAPAEEKVEALLDAVHGAVAASGLFDEGHIKVRAVPLSFYRLGGRRAPFIHLQLRIHGGRSAERKRALSEGVLAAVRAQQWPVEVITVEVAEMERASYAKYQAN